MAIILQCEIFFCKKWKIIMTHKFKSGNLNIVLNVNSNASHVFDDLSYKILDYWPDQKKIFSELKNNYSREEIQECIDEIKNLEIVRAPGRAQMQTRIKIIRNNRTFKKEIDNKVASMLYIFMSSSFSFVFWRLSQCP